MLPPAGAPGVAGCRFWVHAQAHDGADQQSTVSKQHLKQKQHSCSRECAFQFIIGPWLP